jgi:proteasome accessory factor B
VPEKTPRIQRLLRMVEALHTGECRSVADLAALTGSSRRTVFRDLTLLAKCGVPFEFDGTKRGYFALYAAKPPRAAFTLDELDALLVSACLVVQPGRAPDEDAARSACRKLYTMLPETMRARYRDLGRKILIHREPTSDVSSFRGLFRAVEDSLLKQTKMQVEYRSLDGERPLRSLIHPYGLIHADHAWQVIAFVEAKSCVQALRMGRITQWKQLMAPFRIAPAFRLQDYFGQAWSSRRSSPRHHVVVRFERSLGISVGEILWHPTQTTSFDDDGAVLFEVDVDGLEEIAQWILGFGDRAEALQPPDLRRLLAQQTLAMSARYNHRSTAIHPLGEDDSPALVLQPRPAGS